MYVRSVSINRPCLPRSLLLCAELETTVRPNVPNMVPEPPLFRTESFARPEVCAVFDFPIKRPVIVACTRGGVFVFSCGGRGGGQ